jgi:hypothetical protein
VRFVRKEDILPKVIYCFMLMFLAIIDSLLAVLA